jgi:hypothetical protein
MCTLYCVHIPLGPLIGSDVQPNPILGPEQGWLDEAIQSSLRILDFFFQPGFADSFSICEHPTKARSDCFMRNISARFWRMQDFGVFHISVIAGRS